MTAVKLSFREVFAQKTSWFTYELQKMVSGGMFASRSARDGAKTKIMSLALAGVEISLKERVGSVTAGTFKIFTNSCLNLSEVASRTK